jgi:hypothetical protein
VNCKWAFKDQGKKNGLNRDSAPVKTRLPSKYVDVVTIRLKKTFFLATSFIPLPLVSFTCLLLVDIVFSNRMPKIKLLTTSSLASCQSNCPSPPGNHFPGIGVPVGFITYKYLPAKKYVDIDQLQVLV